MSNHVSLPQVGWAWIVHSWVAHCAIQRVRPRYTAHLSVQIFRIPSLGSLVITIHIPCSSAHGYYDHPPLQTRLFQWRNSMPLLPTCLGYPCWTHPYTRHLQEWDISLPELNFSLVEQPLSLLVHLCCTSLGL